ncbi:hypothetical protein MON38_02770 [Hymenobacter sp. DH14]|uniref:Uncharacterized protein n=1 Tax=Hymenobacter cyanobacteriorum TaxID=2926463 RepID=A0A9X1VCT8_9BACT|nr:hypothetical protein [Hymenobacter cyanobacteriorum]MCI1186327.1 hypothetical protein [Hymenobacter cyanobacteriorum]
MPLTSFDFQQARVKQVLFKSRLRSVLYGVREAEASLFQPNENPLGQWIQTALHPQHGTHPEVRALDHTVRQMLSAGQDLTTRYQRGQIEEARTGLDKIDAFANQIEVLLLSLERGLALA